MAIGDRHDSERRLVAPFFSVRRVGGALDRTFRDLRRVRGVLGTCFRPPSWSADSTSMTTRHVRKIAMATS